MLVETIYVETDTLKWYAMTMEARFELFCPCPYSPNDTLLAKRVATYIVVGRGWLNLGVMLDFQLIKSYEVEWF